jgi:hypothetical protein
VRKPRGRRLCCERFKDRYERGEISYAYQDHRNIDETEWFISDLWHLYYCPFCGAFIKGHGFGNYDEKYPPPKGVKVFSQQPS